MAETRRDYYGKRLASLKKERSSWLNQWRDISAIIQPVRGRFLITDQNRGENRHQDIIDSTGTRALRTLAAGLMAGMTSPARPWFRLSVADHELGERPAVHRWLADVTDVLRAIFARSNVYRALHSKYEELGAFGTAAGLLEDDFDKVLRSHVLTCGEYMLAQNHRQEVDTLYREFNMPARSVAQMFGFKRCSTAVQNLIRTKNYDAGVPIVHAVEPRQDRDPRKLDAINMPWASVYFERGSREKEVLRESGYRDFRVVAPRWSVIGGDVYGRGPSMEALGDVKQLQRSQLMKGKAIDYQADPPVQIPTSLKNSDDVDLLPGGTSYYNEAAGPNSGIRNAFEVNLNLAYLLEDIRDTRERINQAYYVDMFLMISQMDTQRTATEIAARQEEKLLMLGPVLERLHNELLDPYIDVTFNRALRAGILPPPPEALQGADLKVEYLSMLAQAQKAVGLNAVDRVLGTVGAVAGVRPEAADKLNIDELIDGYSEMLGIDPDFIVANEDVAIIRQNRAQMQIEAAQAQAAPGLARATKDMADAAQTSGAGSVSQFSGL
ncbi:MAG: portal protein [Dehalococcoidia bacterium]